MAYMPVVSACSFEQYATVIDGIDMKAVRVEYATWGTGRMSMLLVGPEDALRIELDKLHLIFSVEDVSPSKEEIMKLLEDLLS